jgi:hypothetical protein
VDKETAITRRYVGRHTIYEVVCKMNNIVILSETYLGSTKIDRIRFELKTYFNESRELTFCSKVTVKNSPHIKYLYEGEDGVWDGLEQPPI